MYRDKLLLCWDPGANSDMGGRSGMVGVAHHILHDVVQIKWQERPQQPMFV